MEYIDFLKAKMCLAKKVGIEINDDEINPLLKPHQRDIVRWAIEGGRRAIFASFGLGKTFIQLEICRLLLKRVGGKALIVCPLGVRGEFMRDAEKLSVTPKFVQSTSELTDDGLYLTNYESIRIGKLDPKSIGIISTDEAQLFRGGGASKTFREFMACFEGTSTFRFVATATPDPNEYIELLVYAAYLGIMDIGQAKTTWFKRDPTKADVLTLHPHKEQEFWLWVASWAIFLQKPSDLGHSDDGYELPSLDVQWHELPSNTTEIPPDRDGQGKLFPDPVLGLSEAAREKRNSMEVRIERMMELIKAHRKSKKTKNKQFVVWCDLNPEQDAIEKALKEAKISFTSLRGSQGIEEREAGMNAWRNRETDGFISKLTMYGSGVNLQQAHMMTYVGIGYKFADVAQGLHRIYRFLQEYDCQVHFIYTDAELSVRKTLEVKWGAYNKQIANMSGIIKEHGLASINTEETLRRTLGCNRQEASGDKFLAIHNDAIVEAASLTTDSVHLIVTSIPFAFQYEYTASFNDLGHNDSNDTFWQQMDYLTPNLLRILQPGRAMAIHVKDRIVPGGLTGLGFQTLHPFHCEAIYHYQKHGFAFLGMKTVVTDVVRENNQTYRLGWSEQCKDGSRMGCGVPEYVLLFRKPPTDRSVGYADVPVGKEKPRCTDHGDPAPFDTTTNYRNPIPGEGYSRSRWQLDAHGFQRDGGNRLISTEELMLLPHATLYKLWKKRSLFEIYNFEEHVRIAEEMDQSERLPTKFMLMPPHSWHPDVWTDIPRMRTLNNEQQHRGAVAHICPLQEFIIKRLVTQFSMEGEKVFDPFMGIGSVPYYAIKLGRIGMGVELNPGYYKDAVLYCKRAEAGQQVPSLFDLIAEEDEALIDG